MNKLFGLLLLALVAVAPSAANAASCFWVGGSGTWDNTNTGGGGTGGIKWASASGGGTACAATSGPAAGVPGPSDTATIDGNAAGLNGGTITVSGATIDVQQLIAGAANGTINFGTNNVTVSGNASNSVSFTGTGTRTINMGSGTWTLSAGGFDFGTTTNCTSCVVSNAPIIMNGTTLSRNFSGGGLTYNTLTIGSNSSKGFINFGQANTFSSITVGSGNTLLMPQGTTNTITGALTMTGTASLPVGLQSNGVSTNASTLSVGAASTITWGSILRMTRSGAGTLDATNSFDLGGNNTGASFTISPPSGGGGGGRIIGG